MQETLLTVESLCFFTMASLDLFARAVDHFLSITVSPTQKPSRTTFSSLLGCIESDDECNEPKKTLISQFPDLPITHLWEDAWNEWIKPLAQRRHALTHDSILLPIEVAHRGASFADELPDSTDLAIVETEDALEFADGVITKLRDFFRSSFLIIMQMSQEWNERESTELPEYPPDLPLKEWNPTDINLEEALNAWITTSADNEDAIKIFYHRLHADLQKTWSLPQCESFLRANKLTSYRVTKGTGHTAKDYDQINRALVHMTVGDREIDVWFSLVKARSDRWHIIREPISTFPDPIVRLECKDIWRKQSDRSSGYRDLLYGAILRNTSEDLLSNITLTLCQGGQVSDYSELHTTTAGSLAPKEQTSLDCRFANGCLPPYGFRLLSGPLSMRLCYDTPDGQRYSGDFTFQEAAT
jgi:hypothetical protein